MKRLDQYLISQIFAVFLFGVIAFTSIFAGVGIIPNLVREASSYGINLITVLKLFTARLPQVMVYTFPMAILLSSLQVYGNLSSNSEITAMRATGISLPRIIAPALVFGLMISFLTLFFNESLVPKSNLYVEYLIAKAKNEFKPIIRTSVNIPQYENGELKRTVNAKKMYKNMMEEITVTEYDNNYLKRVIFAQKADFISGKGWIFFQGIMYLFDQETDTLSRITFEAEEINLKINPTEIEVIMENSQAGQKNFKQLSNQISIKEKTGEDTAKLRIELFAKLSLPFACFIFTLLGAPLGLNPQRRSNSVGIGLSLLVVIGYYLLMAIGEWLGYIHILTPILAAWLPNLLIGFIGGFLIYTKSKI